MQIAIIAGSHRKNSESGRVAEYLKQSLMTTGAKAEVINLAGNPLPLWSADVFADESFKKTWGAYSEILKASDGLVVVSPEWAGMVPAGLKNFLLFCSSEEVGHKPALIVGVSAGIGGSYPIAELRTSSYKNNHLCYIPDHVIVRNVGDMLHGEAPAHDRDKSIRERLAYSLKVLCSYSTALKQVRTSDVIDFESYPYGM